ncbi:hypothetical protein C8R45DRAFT_945183 [Mycena sanguinolenta]|nr:hypothetical protein C8R45DRAFT_945183 [Mycena sanguinolenta]
MRSFYGRFLRHFPDRQNHCRYLGSSPDTRTEASLNSGKTAELIIIKWRRIPSRLSRSRGMPPSSDINSIHRAPLAEYGPSSNPRDDSNPDNRSVLLPAGDYPANQACMRKSGVILRYGCHVIHSLPTDFSLAVVKHGIPDEVIQRSLETSAEFFALGDEPKMLLWQEEPVSIHVGYRPSLDSKIDPRGTHDPVEGFTVKWEESGSAEYGNKWPEALPGMSDAVMDYYTHGLRVGKQLYQLIALAMGVEENFFEHKTKNNITRLRLLRYPAQTSEVIGGGKHSDFGTFTILLQQPEIEARQVDAPQTGWTFVPPVPGTVVVNLGDQCTICTNGVFRSPIHRVISRPGPDRYSIPLFFLADFDVVLQPDDSFVTAEHPSQYEPMTAGQQYAKRIADAWDH